SPEGALASTFLEKHNGLPGVAQDPKPPPSSTPAASVSSRITHSDVNRIDDIDAYSDWSVVFRHPPSHSSVYLSPQTRRSFVNAGIPISFIKGGAAAPRPWGVMSTGGGGRGCFSSSSVLGLNNTQPCHPTSSFLSESSGAVCTPGKHAQSSSSSVYLSEAAVRAAAEADAVAHLLEKQREKQSRLSQKESHLNHPSAVQDSTKKGSSGGWSVRNLFMKRDETTSPTILTEKREPSFGHEKNLSTFPDVQKEEKFFSGTPSESEMGQKREGEEVKTDSASCSVLRRPGGDEENGEGETSDRLSNQADGCRRSSGVSHHTNERQTTGDEGGMKGGLIFDSCCHAASRRSSGSSIMIQGHRTVHDGSSGTPPFDGGLTSKSPCRRASPDGGPEVKNSERDKERGDEGDKEKKMKTTASRPSRLSWLWGGGGPTRGGSGDGTVENEKQETETQENLSFQGERKTHERGVGLTGEKDDGRSLRGGDPSRERQQKGFEGEQEGLRSSGSPDRRLAHVPGQPDAQPSHENRLNSLGRFFTLRKPSQSSLFSSSTSPREAIRRKREIQDALHREDLEAMLSNVQQVKHFLVVKLRECEAALLATARERDDLEESLRQLGSSLQEKEAQREETLQALQARSRQQETELDELRAEVSRLREQEEKLQGEITQLKDERTLLRAEVHDRMAANSLASEKLHRSIQQLKDEKKILVREVVSLRRALAESRQELADALARVDELESFIPSSSPPSPKTSPIIRPYYPLSSPAHLQSPALNSVKQTKTEEEDLNDHRSVADPACSYNQTSPRMSAFEVEKKEPTENDHRDGKRRMMTKNEDSCDVGMIRKDVDRNSEEEKSSTVLGKLVVGGLLSPHRVFSSSSSSFYPFPCTCRAVFTSSAEKNTSPLHELQPACDFGGSDEESERVHSGGYVPRGRLDSLFRQGIGRETTAASFSSKRRAFSLSCSRRPRSCRLSCNEREGEKVMKVSRSSSRPSEMAFRRPSFRFPREGNRCVEPAMSSRDRASIVSDSCVIDRSSSSSGCRADRSFYMGSCGDSVRDTNEERGRRHSLGDVSGLKNRRHSRRGRQPQLQEGDKNSKLSKGSSVRAFSSASMSRFHDSGVYTPPDQKSVGSRSGKSCHSSSVSRGRVSTAASSPSLKEASCRRIQRSDLSGSLPSSYTRGGGVRDRREEGDDTRPFLNERGERLKLSKEEIAGSFSLFPDRNSPPLTQPHSCSHMSDGIPARVGELERKTSRRADECETEENVGGAGGKGTALEVAERVGGALAAGVSRVWQHLEHALTVEETLIIDHSGVYTPDGVCVERIHPPPGDGYRRTQPENGTDPNSAKTTHASSATPFFSNVGKYFSPDTFLGGGEGLPLQQGRSRKGVPRRDTTGCGGDEVELGEKQRKMREQQEAKKISSSRASKDFGGGRRLISSLTFRSVSANPSSSALLYTTLDQPRLPSNLSEKEEEVERAADSITGTGDIVVMLSESEGEGEPGDLNSDGRRKASRRQERGLFDHSHFSQKNRRRHSNTIGSSNLTSKVLGSSLSDAVCSVWHAAQEALSDSSLLHMPNQHPHFSILPPGHDDPLCSYSSTKVISGSHPERRTSPGGGTTQRDVDLHSPICNGETPAGVTVRYIPPHSRLSAWEQLLQRHREAQDMPLFGSTPYPMSAGLLSKKARSHTHSQAAPPGPTSKSAVAVQVTQRKRGEEPAGDAYRFGIKRGDQRQKDQEGGGGLWVSHPEGNVDDATVSERAVKAFSRGGRTEREGRDYSKRDSVGLIRRTAKVVDMAVKDTTANKESQGRLYFKDCLRRSASAEDYQIEHERRQNSQAAPREEKRRKTENKGGTKDYGVKKDGEEEFDPGLIKDDRRKARDINSETIGKKDICEADAPSCTIPGRKVHGSGDGGSDEGEEGRSETDGRRHEEKGVQEKEEDINEEGKRLLHDEKASSALGSTAIEVHVISGCGESPLSALEDGSKDLREDTPVSPSSPRDQVSAGQEDKATVFSDKETPLVSGGSPVTELPEEATNIDAHPDRNEPAVEDQDHEKKEDDVSVQPGGLQKSSEEEFAQRQEKDEGELSMS
ncbi:hypothetical protein CSUI_005792, partial [Cystoisospora suis]